MFFEPFFPLALDGTGAGSAWLHADNGTLTNRGLFETKDGNVLTRNVIGTLENEATVLIGQPTDLGIESGATNTGTWTVDDVLLQLLNRASFEHGDGVIQIKGTNGKMRMPLGGSFTWSGGDITSDGPDPKGEVELAYVTLSIDAASSGSSGICC